MSDPVPPPAPERNEEHRTILWGEDIKRAIEIMGITPQQFCRLTGLNESRFMHHLDGGADDKIPIAYEFLLYSFWRLPDLRTQTGPIPFDGSDQSGADIKRALERIGISAPRFCKLTGTSERRFKKQLRGANDGDLPATYRFYLHAMERLPELKTCHLPLDLPFEEWGVEVNWVED